MTFNFKTFNKLNGCRSLIKDQFCCTVLRRHSNTFPSNYGIRRCDAEVGTSDIRRFDTTVLYDRIRRPRCFSTDTRILPIIYLFTKEGCTLCDEAKLSLKPYNHRFILEEVDITLPENEPWYDMYKYDIPVFHMFEDFLFKHRVNFEVLEKALKTYEGKQ